MPFYIYIFSTTSGSGRPSSTEKLNLLRVQRFILEVTFSFLLKFVHKNFFDYYMNDIKIVITFTSVGLPHNLVECYSTISLARASSVNGWLNLLHTKLSVLFLSIPFKANR